MQSIVLHLYFGQNRPTLQHGLSAIAELPYLFLLGVNYRKQHVEEVI